jgi:hypothetical protein
MAATNMLPLHERASQQQIPNSKISIAGYPRQITGRRRWPKVPARHAHPIRQWRRLLNSVILRTKITGGVVMAFYAFYVIAAIVLVLHFTGWLKRNRLEWLVLVMAVAVFPVVIFLR